MKFRLFFIAVSITSFLWVLATAVMAQGEPPPPYAGLKNPFPWSDASAQEAGKKLYQQSCLGCHGAKGNNLAESDFSTTDYPQSLEERPDFYFWVLSEGRLDKGMPPYKSSLSEEQRWQVLTYLWSLGAAASPEVPPRPPHPPAEGDTLLLTVPKQVQAGQPLTLNAILQDSQDKPISGATVKFSIKVDFFASSLMEIGEVLTDGKGIAVFEYTPRVVADTEVVAQYGTIKAIAPLTIAPADKPLYQAKAGFQLPAPGKPVFIGPSSALQLDKMGDAPTSAFYLPGGILSWLLIVVVTVMAIWLTYFRVMYQVYRIPIVSEIRDTNTRLIPLAGLAIVLVLGIMLMLMLLTGPYSHFHLLR